MALHQRFRQAMVRTAADATGPPSIIPLQRGVSRASAVVNIEATKIDGHLSTHFHSFCVVSPWMSPCAADYWYLPMRQKR